MPCFFLHYIFTDYLRNKLISLLSPGILWYISLSFFYVIPQFCPVHFRDADLSASSRSGLCSWVAWHEAVQCWDSLQNQWLGGVTCSLPDFEKSTYSVFLSLSNFKVVNHDNTNTGIIELLWASNVGEAHRTLSAPSKYSTNVGSISKSNPFFLIIDDLVVGMWPTCGWRDKKAWLGSPWGKCLRWSNRVTWRISVLPLCVVGSGYDPWCHFAFSLRLKATWGWLGRDEKTNKQTKKQSFMAKISWLLYLSWI